MNLKVILLGALASLSFVSTGADAAAAKADASGAVMREKVAKFWDLLPFNPEEAVYMSGEALEADPTAKDSMGPAARRPPDDKGMWGKWIFWNGQWWAKNFIQPEAEGVSWQRPAKGMTKDWKLYNSFWFRATMKVPADWAGRTLNFELADITGCDVVVFANGRRAGVIYRPKGKVDVTKFVKAGADNEFMMLVSSQGYQIPDRADPTKGRYTNQVRHRECKFNANPPFLVATPPVCIEDVFANTSWRQKKLTVEADIAVQKPCTAEFLAEAFDADGKRVKSVKGSFKLKPGVNAVSAATDWKDPITWEVGRGYLYTLKSSVRIDGKTYRYRDVKFGFREIWREERKIMMNGHVQNYRVTYNFGCNGYGAKFLTLLGYNCIQFAHRTELDPGMDEGMLEYLSANGIACIVPTTAFDWNTKNNLMAEGPKRTEFMQTQAMNLKRFRNWPCIAMVYMGVNCYLPQWAYEAIHMGSGDGSPFGKMLDALVAEAKKTNPNVLYFSHSDGNTGEIASANLYLNWVPLQEREEWPSRWAVRGHYPFQACEFGHPFQHSWYKEDADYVSEYCAIYYGEDAYRDEPEAIRVRHKPGVYIRRILHPSFWKLTDDFCWRTTRAWRTFGVNAGIVWFNLDYGYGMPGWKYPNIWNQYNPAYNCFKTEADVPKGKPEWAFPSWDAYRKGNLDFLGWIGGSPRITDRRHAYWPGEKVVKSSIMLWDRFDTRAFTATWTATLGGRKIGGGAFKRELKCGEPVTDRIVFEAPEVKAKGAGRIEVVFRDAAGKEVDRDEAAFEVFPRRKAAWAKAPEFALYDPDGKTATELARLGVVNLRKVAAPAEAADAKHLVIGAFALGKEGFAALPMEAVAKGLKILVLPQNAEALKAFGFEVQDRMSRQLYLRDVDNPAWKSIDGDCLREWDGAPRTAQKNAWGLQQYGSLAPHPKHELRWTYNMAIAALQPRTPDTVGWIPQVEGEFDMNYTGLLQYHCGLGSVQFCTLDFLGRIHTGGKEDDKAAPATDPATEAVAEATLKDFLLVAPGDHSRTVTADGNAAVRIATTLGARQGKASGKGAVLLVGSDSKLDWARVREAAKGGANVLVVCNDALAKAAGFSLEAVPQEANCYLVGHDAHNPALRGIGQAQLRWRDRMSYTKLVSAPAGFKIDAEGMFASGRIGDAEVWFSQYDPFRIEDTIATESTFLVDAKPRPVKPEDRERSRKRCQTSFERSHQFTARLLTNLGAAPDGKTPLYNGLVKNFDPYYFTFW